MYQFFKWSRFLGLLGMLRMIWYFIISLYCLCTCNILSFRQPFLLTADALLASFILSLTEWATIYSLCQINYCWEGWLTHISAPAKEEEKLCTLVQYSLFNTQYTCVFWLSRSWQYRLVASWKIVYIKRWAKVYWSWCFWQYLINTLSLDLLSDSIKYFSWPNLDR